MKKVFLVFLIYCALSNLSAETLRIAVSPLDFPEGDTIGQTLSDTVLDIMALSLETSGTYQPVLVGRPDNFQQLDDICRDNEAHYLISGRLNVAGSNYILSLSLFDLSEKSTTLNLSVGVDTLMAIFDQTDLLISRFLGQMNYFDLQELKGMDFYSQGRGTEEDPFQIATVTDLVNIGLEPSAYFILVDDIDLTGLDWVPIDSFSGNLNGQNHSISYLSISQSKYRSTGMFSQLAADGVIKSVILKDVSIDGFTVTGALVGKNYGLIENCEVLGGNVSGEYDTGGLCGDNSALIRGCYAEVEVSGHVLSIGGLVGSNSGQLLNSGSRCVVSIDGVIQFDPEEYPHPDYLDFAGNTAGGLVGSNYPETGVIDQCYSYSTIISSRSGIGGLVGWNGEGTITNSYACPQLITAYSCGGFTGMVRSSRIESCYSVVREIKSSADTGLFLGDMNYQSTGAQIKNCFAFALKGHGASGIPAVGRVETGNRISVIVLQSETRFLNQNKNPYKKWDFETVWEMTENGPILRNVPYYAEQNPLIFQED